VPNSIALAVISGQLSFQLHDAGHHQMFRDRWRNVVVNGVPYQETSFVGSYTELLRFLHSVGAPLRSPAEHGVA
jgi:hypothetical protein